MDSLNTFVDNGSDMALVGMVEHTNYVGSFAKLACIAALAHNDLHHIHFNVSGRGFDRIHNLAGQYYYDLDSQVDYLVELAMEHKQIVPNLTFALKCVPEWPVLTQAKFDYDSSIRAIKAVLQNYTDALTEARETLAEPDEQSKLDEYIRDWNKELHYKLEHRLDGEGCCEGEPDYDECC